MRAEATLEQACDVIVDCPHNTARNSTEVSPYAYAVGTKAISNSRIDFTQTRPVDEATYRDWIKRATPREGDVLLCREAPVGPVVRIPRTPRVCLGQRTVLLRPNPDVVDGAYLLYVLSSPSSQRAFLALAEGSTVAHLNVADVRRFSVSLPPLREQRRVGEILRALDDKIDSNRRLAKLLEEAAATLFRARFVDFVGVEEFEESEIGRIPSGWDVRRIGQVLDTVGGGTPSTKEPAYWDGGTRCWATPKDLSGHTSPVLLDTSRHVTDAGAARISSGVLPPETVLLSSRAPIGYTAMSKVPMAINQGFIAIRPSDRLPNEYVLFWIRQNLETIKNHAGGTTFAEISKRGFRPIPILIPPEEALTEFAHVARAALGLIAGMDREQSRLGAARDALLPKLISGEIRVPDTSDPGEVIEPVAEEIAAAAP